MHISDCMKRNIFSIQKSNTLGEAVRIFAERHIGTLPVVDEQGALVGLLQLRDLLTLVMPDFVKFIEDFDFVMDFGAAENRQPSPELLAKKVGEFMRPPEAVEATSGLLRASALLHKHDLHDLPVVDANGKLVGIASRVDVGTAFLKGWNISQGGGA
ncbi:MAG: HPP family protein [Chloroflexota bacterium]